MLIVSLIKPVEASAYILSRTSYNYGVKLSDNKLYVEQPAFLSAMGQGWDGGVFKLGLKHDKRVFSIAGCNIQNFTNNCGIRAITQLFTYDASIGPLFLQLLENYLAAGKYSVVIGSDGQQTGAKSLSFIQTHGKGWKVESLGRNQRIQSMNDNLTLFWKYLKPQEHLAEWED